MGRCDGMATTSHPESVALTGAEIDRVVCALMEEPCCDEPDCPDNTPAGE